MVSPLKPLLFQAGVQVTAAIGLPNSPQSKQLSWSGLRERMKEEERAAELGARLPYEA